MGWKDKSKGLVWRRAHRQKIKLLIKDYLSNHPCVRCGFSDIRALDFDHVEPKHKNKAISTISKGTPSVKYLMEEISKCQVLCANCHRIKTIENKDYDVV